jgi:4-hydroxy-tetrahydrodipicolinate synthase
LFDALTNEDWERARELRNACIPYQNFRDQTGQNNTLKSAISVPAVKKGLELAGLHGGNVREPIRALSPKDEAMAEEIYQKLDDDINRLIS